MPAQSEPLHDQSHNSDSCIRLNSGAFPIGTWELDLKNKDVWISKQYARILGYDTPPADWSLNCFLDHVFDEDRPLMDRYIKRLLNKPDNVEVEHRIRKVDGQTRWIRNIGGIEYDEQGIALWLRGITIDITNHKNLEQQLAHLQTQWDFASGVFGLGLFIFDTKSFNACRNNIHAKIFGYEAGNTEKWSLRVFLEHIVPEDRPKVEAIIDDAFMHKIDYRFECRIIRTDGVIRWINVAVKIVTIELENHEYGIGVVQDITEQKLLEEMHNAKQLQWDITANLCHIGMWRVDLETNQVFQNKENANIFGQLSNHLDKSVSGFIETVAAEDRGWVADLCHECLKTHKDVNFDCRIFRPDGQERWVNIIASFQFNERGESTCAVGTCMDITEKKTLEIKKQQLEEQLLQSQKMELLGQLAGGIAHDFNNSLASIMGNTELILNATPATDHHYQNLHSILHSVNRSAEMVSQLLAFARKQPICPKELEVDHELEHMYLILRNMIREDITLQWKLNCPGALVLLDPANLVQIITNFCVNARDAIDGFGVITLETSIVNAKTCEALQRIAVHHSGDYICISVSDTGSGIADDILPHIFEPFYTTKGVGNGTGLGLSMVYGSVRQNHGYVTCESLSGQGATFNLFFPLSQSVKTNNLSPFEIEPEIHDKITVLIVDDEPAIVQILMMSLEQEGFQVLSAANAEEAIALVRNQNHEISLTVTDVILPGMNGVEMSHELQKMNPEMNFLFISGYSVEALGEYGHINEETNFLSKPFSISTLLKKVKDILKKNEKKYS